MARSYLTFETLFCVFSLIVPSVMVLAPKGVVPVLLITAVATLLVWRVEGRTLQPPTALTLGPLILLLLWATLASLWSFEPGPALRLSLRIAGILAAGLWLMACAATLARHERRRIAAFLAAGFAVAVTILAVEVAFGHPFGKLLLELGLGPEIMPYRFNRGSTYLAILVWPLTVAAWAWMGPKALIVPAGLLLLFLPLNSLSAIFSLLLALAFLPLAFFHLRSARLLLTAGVVLSLLAAPFLTLTIDRDVVREIDYLPGNTLHRLHIWSYTGERILEESVFGWGFNASRSMPVGEGEGFRRDRRDAIPLHPHNAALQIWLELGVIGAGLLCALVLVLLLRLSRIERIDQIFGLATFLGAFLVASVSYGLWQNQWITALLISALTFQICRLGADPKVDGRRH